MEEQELLRLAQRGDNEAVTQLVKTYQQNVYNVCYRMLGESTEAEDATQDTMVKALTNLSSYDASRSFRPWLLRIASNECIDRIRRRKDTISLDGLGDDGAWEWKAGDSPNPEAELLHRERQTTVREILEQLSPADRMVVQLFYWENLPYAEIEEITGLTVSAIKSRLFRARRVLAGLLVQEGSYV